jgi:excisionase family DNA binding protein
MTKRTEQDLTDLLTPAEASAVLRVSPRTLSRYETDGKIQCLRTPGGHRRFRRHDVEALLEAATS